MNFAEHAAKPLLWAANIATPRGYIADGPDQAATATVEFGNAVLKAQVPIGKRGKAGGIVFVSTPEEAAAAATKILGMEIGGYKVKKLLVEQRVPIREEFYAAILNDAASKSPLLLFSPEGGMDIEEIAAKHPDKLVKHAFDVRHGFDRFAVHTALPDLPDVNRYALIDVLEKLYSVYVTNDAELIEINPLVLTEDGYIVALDCKYVLDDSAIKRQEALAKQGTREKQSLIEARAAAIGLKYIGLDGNIGVLANGAGLTMTSMDAIRHYGGSPANFLEIGGEAYRQGKEALEIVLATPGIKSLLVNFCGAFARTDVMVKGIVEAWDELKPDIPIFFTIHGTGEEAANAIVRARLDVTPYDVMDDAVRAAVEAAR